MNTAEKKPVLLDDEQGNWSAHLWLEFETRQAGTRMVKANHRGPLYVQKPFYPEGADCAHVYLLHPPGGMVSGDSLDIRVAVDQGSHVLVTTPGAGRAYGARETNKLKQTFNRLSVADNASLEWFPMENIVYSDAHLKAKTEVNLALDAQFIGWEINCLGLPASDAPFRNGDFFQRLQVNRAGVPVFIDQLHICSTESALFQGCAGMAGHSVSATMVAGPFADIEQLKTLTELLQAEMIGEPALSMTQLDQFFVARYLGDSAFDARGLFVQIWGEVRPKLIKREACVPRIWHT